jgi:hypothetical protein
LQAEGLHDTHKELSLLTCRAAIILCLLLAFLPACFAQPAAREDLPFDFRGDSARVEGNVLVIKGNVWVKREDFEITADEAEINQETNWGAFRGNVTLTSPEGAKAQMQSLSFNIETSEWAAEQGASTWLQPQFFEEGVVEPVRVSGERLEAKPGGEDVTVLGGGFTSCDKPHPHYSLRSPRVEVQSRRRLFAKRPRLYLGDKEIVRLPVDLKLSLRERRHAPIMPEFGENDYEGKYVKLAYNYTAGEDQWGAVHLDITQKRGLREGIEHFFESESSRGSASLFYEAAQKSLTGRLEHSADFSRATSYTTSLNFSQNSAFATTKSQRRDLNLVLRNRDDDSDTSLSFNRSSTSGTYRQGQFSSDLRHTQRWDNGLTASLTSTLRDSTTGQQTPNNRDLDARVVLEQRGHTVDWTLTAENRWDLDEYEGDNSFQSLQRLPEVVMRTDSQRLHGRLMGKLPGSIEMSLGQFRERRATPGGAGAPSVSLFRGAVDLQLGGYGAEPIPLGPRSRLRLTGRLRQSVYGNDTAQYVVGTRLDLENDHGGGWSSRLNYDFTGSAGFSPYRFDYSGNYNALRGQFGRMLSGRLRLSTDFGRDLDRGAWRDVSTRAQIRTGGTSALDLSTGFSPERHEWRSLIMRYVKRAPGEISSSLGLRYDIERGELDQLRGELDWFIRDMWRLEWLAGYNGRTSRLDYNDIRLTRDLHCWTAQLTYSQQQGELRLNLGINAFPTRERMFGVGTQGQYLDTTLGEQL